MLKPLKRDKKNVFSTVDIETGKDGHLIEGAIYDGESITFFQTWKQFFSIVEDNNNNKLYQKFIAHAGGSFDFVSMFEYILTTDIEADIIMSGSDCIFINVTSFNHPVIFQDSMRVMQKGLKKLAKLFECEQLKEDIDIKKIEEIYKTDIKTFRKYLSADVISLYQVSYKFMEILDIDFFPVTVASLALYIFRKRFQKTEYFQISKEIVDKFINEAYAGGRVECYEVGKVNNVNTYDINSIYPYIMKNKAVPMGLPTYTKKYRPKKLGFYRINFNQKNKSIPPIFWEKTKNGLEFVYSGTGVYFQAEIELGLQHNVEIEFMEGWTFHRQEKIFSDYVDHFYNLRQEYKGTAIDAVSKLMLNSLYGKFAQKEKSEKLVRWNKDNFREKIKKVKNWKPYIEDKGLFIVEDYRKIPHRMIHFSACITSYARVELYNYLNRYKDNVVYCDTDCIHLKNKLMDDKYIGKDLGYMKKEISGNAIYTGRKQYIINDKIKFKGVKTDCKLTGNKFTLTNYQEILNNNYTKYEYGTFPKLKTMLKGGVACKVQIIPKELKGSEYLSNYKKE